eukprot:1160201-Pelagomonas_calceolata.AAC.4
MQHGIVRKLAKCCNVDQVYQHPDPSLPLLELVALDVFIEFGGIGLLGESCAVLCSRSCTSKQAMERRGQFPIFVYWAYAAGASAHANCLTYNCFANLVIKLPMAEIKKHCAPARGNAELEG